MALDAGAIATTGDGEGASGILCFIGSSVSVSQAFSELTTCAVAKQTPSRAGGCHYACWLWRLRGGGGCFAGQTAVDTNATLTPVPTDCSRLTSVPIDCDATTGCLKGLSVPDCPWV